MIPTVKESKDFLESKLAGFKPEVALIVGSGLKFIAPGPSNVYMFDVRDPTAPTRVAAVSVTESAADGTVLKTFMRKKYVYTITFPHGIQVIDLALARQLFKTANDNAQSRLEMNRALVTEGIGFGQSAIVQTIPLHTPTGEGASSGARTTAAG